MSPCQGPSKAKLTQIDVSNISAHGILATRWRRILHALRGVPLVQVGQGGRDSQGGGVVSGAFPLAELDIDIGIDTLRDPERFPLKSRADAAMSMVAERASDPGRWRARHSSALEAE